MAFTLKTICVRYTYYQNYINWLNLLNINKNTSYRKVRYTYRAYEDNSELKIEVFRHFPRIAKVKKSRDQGLAIRLDHAREVYKWVRIPQGFLNPKTSQFHVWEERRNFRTLVLTDYRIPISKKVILKTIYLS